MRLAENTQKSLAYPVVAAVLVFLMASMALAVEPEPYEARVVTPGASLHAGPGENFYAADTLSEGEVVEVYREEPSGWLGIRPPEDSFSWVFGSHVKRLDGALAESDKDEVASRIGSRLSNQRNAVQVRLRKGEVIEIIGEATIEGKKWYKIAPPSGEFRWIHSRNVERVDAPAAAGSVEPDDADDRPIVTVPLAEPVVTQPAELEQGSKLAAESAGVTLVADSQPQDDPTWRAAPAEPAGEAGAPNATVESSVTAPPSRDEAAAATSTTADKSAQVSTATAAATAAPVAEVEQPLPPSASQLPITPIPGHDLTRQLIDVELRLSRMVAEPPANWQIEPLRREVERLIMQVASDSDRNELNSTLAKLDRFAAIAQRYQQGARHGASSTWSTEQGAISQRFDSSLPAPSSTLTPDTSRYDAVGILRPVVSKRPGAPQFAMVDDRGQVVSFVTPSPDVNLQPYLGHRIGVSGNRGFIPEFQRSHVTAGRVAPLGGRMVR